MSWAAQEFETLDLGDARLNKRAVLLAERLAAKPTASIPNACSNWTETIAAYRFLNNDRLSWEDVMQPHWQASVQRMAAHPLVLCLQDTTELDYNGQQMQGLGPLSYEAQRGMYLHPTYVITPQREPLGVTDAWMWAREPKPVDGQRPGVVESLRWIESYERIAEQAAQLPQTRHVCISDREADIMALLERAHELDYPADYLVRCKHNRVLPEGGKLWQNVMDSATLGCVRFEIAAGRGRKARSVKQEVRVRRVVVKDSRQGRIEVSCLIATEIDPPPGVQPVVWRLLSNRQAVTLEQACELIDWYRARWEIELLFETEEWHAAFILNKKKPPKEVPQLNTVLRLIAQRGGFLARKGDGEPGAKTSWLGMQDVAAFVAGVRYMREAGLGGGVYNE